MSEQAYLAVERITEKMSGYGFAKELVDSASAVFFEATRNAFEHGCRTPSDAIEIRAAVTSKYVAVVIDNPADRPFDFLTCLAQARESLAANPARKRGRGLIQITEMADTVVNSQSGLGIKAVIYGDRVQFSVVRNDNFTVIETVAGLFNPSFERRLLAIASRHLKTHLILDFRRWEGGTVTHSVVIHLHELYASTSRRIIALLPDDSSEAELPEAIVAFSLEEAIAMISAASPPDHISKGRSGRSGFIDSCWRVLRRLLRFV